MVFIKRVFLYYFFNVLFHIVPNLSPYAKKLLFELYIILLFFNLLRISFEFIFILFVVYFRVYAAETSTFLAPYESSLKPRINNTPPTIPDIPKVPQVPAGASASNTDINHPMGQDARSLSADVADWNPFEDPPFNQMSEDHIFGAEFDKIRRGSQSSKST